MMLLADKIERTRPGHQPAAVSCTWRKQPSASAQGHSGTPTPLRPGAPVERACPPAALPPAEPWRNLSRRTPPILPISNRDSNLSETRVTDTKQKGRIILIEKTAPLSEPD